MLRAVIFGVEGVLVDTAVLDSGHGVATFADVTPCLDHLARRGVDTAAASAGRAARTRLVAAGLAPRLDVVVDATTAGPVGRSEEPTIELYRAAARRVARGPDECALVDDSVAGLRAGRGAGVGRLIGLARAPEREAALGAVADVVIDSLAELPAALGWSDDEWVVRFVVTDANRRAVEALTATCDGRFGTRGLLGPSSGGWAPSTIAGGVYDGSPVPDLIGVPEWNGVSVSLGGDASEVATLDLGRGLLRTRMTDADGGWADALRFASMAHTGVHVLEVVAAPGVVVDAGPALVPPSTVPGVEVDEPAAGTMSVSGGRGAVAASVVQELDDRSKLRRIVAFTAVVDPAVPGDVPTAASVELLAAARDLGIDRLTAAQQDFWAETWARVAIDAAAVPDLQTALRFAQYHLLGSATDVGEAAIGARGLTGPAYRGHVFWDTDVYVVPALAAMAPRRARAALEYRRRRLGAARARAAAEGRTGARFPWESADDGSEASPTEGRDLRGNTIPITTGELEVHIVADVAWAVSTYADWTGDEAFLRGAGAEILVETARYWSSRADHDGDGSAHIRTVTGPDEYHEAVDDNCYTNMLAAWNLRRAADLGAEMGAVDPDECRAWRQTADRLVVHYDGHHEQFDGFSALEPLLASSLGTPPVSADAVLGHERIQEVQIVKQPDVLMLHHMIPEQLPVGSLEADLDFYLPRTAHGSSLSPPVTASVLARAGRTDDAMAYLAMAARFDLDDLSGTTAGGLHMATMGGLWQAFTRGFLGIWPAARTLVIDPRLPDTWATVTHRFWYHGAPVRVEASSQAFTVVTDAPIDVTLSDGTHRCDAMLRASRSIDGWARS